MPLLGPTDALPRRPQRVVVNGTSGSGKSTLARRIGSLLTLPYTELDSLHHGPGWTPREAFAAEVDAFTSRPAWVTEYQYDKVRPLLLERADLFVWLDLPRALVLGRLVRRTTGRRIRGEELWNGNREAPLHTFLTDREHVVRYAWRTHHDTAARADTVLRQRPELPVVRLRSPRDVRTWLAGPLTAQQVTRP